MYHAIISRHTYNKKERGQSPLFFNSRFQQKHAAYNMAQGTRRVPC